jgi:hypothetical protein
LTRSGNGARGTGSTRGAGSVGGVRKDARPDARSNRPTSRPSRKPALAAGAKAGNSKRYGFTARPKQETKKRG